MFSYKSLPESVRTTLWAAGRAALAVVVVGLLPILSLVGQPSPNWSDVRVAVVALAVAAVAAAIRVVQHAVQGTLKS